LKQATELERKQYVKETDLNVFDQESNDLLVEEPLKVDVTSTFAETITDE